MKTDLQLWQAEYAELGIPFDFSAEGYRRRLPRIRVLALEGRGPLAWMQAWLGDCRISTSTAGREFGVPHGRPLRERV